MYKSNVTYGFQEFIVQNYSLDEFNQRFLREISSWDEILGPPLECLLPKTKFYLACDSKFLKELPAIENNVYSILMHPMALGLANSSMIYHSIRIDFQDWCLPTEPLKMYQFPVMEYADTFVLDYFKAKTIMEFQGLPPYILKKQNKKTIDKRNQSLNLMKKLNINSSSF